MKKLKRFAAVLLAGIMALALFTACGDSSDDVTGDDWRVSGVVAAEGTITHEARAASRSSVTVRT